MARADMNPRTCIVSREEKSPDQMIRFVLDDGRNVIPDLKRKLPGRGVWVSARRIFVEQAVKENAFSRGFKVQAKADPDLSNLVEKLLLTEALSRLSLARKAGLLVSGRANVEDLVRSGKAAIIVHANGTKGDGRKKIDALAAHYLNARQIMEAFEISELDRISGGANTVHVAVAKGRLAEGITECVGKLKAYNLASNGQV